MGGSESSPVLARQPFRMGYSGRAGEPKADSSRQSEQDAGVASSDSRYGKRLARHISSSPTTDLPTTFKVLRHSPLGPTKCTSAVSQPDVVLTSLRCRDVSHVNPISCVTWKHFFHPRSTDTFECNITENKKSSH